MLTRKGVKGGGECSNSHHRSPGPPLEGCQYPHPHFSHTVPIHVTKQLCRLPCYIHVCRAHLNAPSAVLTEPVFEPLNNTVFLPYLLHVVCTLHTFCSNAAWQYCNGIIYNICTYSYLYRMIEASFVAMCAVCNSHFYLFLRLWQ